LRHWLRSTIVAGPLLRTRHCLYCLWENVGVATKKRAEKEAPAAIANVEVVDEGRVTLVSAGEIRTTATTVSATTAVVAKPAVGEATGGAKKTRAVGGEVAVIQVKATPATKPAAKSSRRKSATSAPSDARNAERAERGSDDDDASGAEDGEESDDENLDAAAPAELADDAEDDDEVEGDADAESDHESYESGAPSESSPQSMAKLDAMALYLREIQRHRLLTPEETRELAIRFRDTEDPAAAARLVTSNLRLVVKIAYEYRRAYKNIMDLVQEGNIGLMQAVKRYDPYRGVKLSSYAAWWIRAYILRFILNNWRLVKLGTTQAQRKLFFNLRKSRAELQARGVDPSDAEVAKHLNVTEAEVSEMEVRLSGAEKSLDAPVGDADGRSIAKIDMMPGHGPSPEAMMADGELQAMLSEKLREFRKTIEGREKDMAIFDERLVADDPLTLQQLGERFGVSRERVRQLEQRLTTRLRDYLKRELGDNVDAHS
jgi:RNA polymerase sigma-32 factor